MKSFLLQNLADEVDILLLLAYAVRQYKNSLNHYRKDKPKFGIDEETIEGSNISSNEDALFQILSVFEAMEKRHDFAEKIDRYKAALNKIAGSAEGLDGGDHAIEVAMRSDTIANEALAEGKKKS